MGKEKEKEGGKKEGKIVKHEEKTDLPSFPKWKTLSFFILAPGRDCMVANVTRY